MCDTQVLIADGAVWFAKNSDREPSEPQSVVRYAAVRGDATPRLKVTHIEIDQVPQRHATILSQPAWCWGAEMGINDAGVAIGNEAIFSKRATLQPGLLGMDLVRLGLERAANARDALQVMTTLLERHGQGGPAGYKDRGFCYDSSFIVADAGEAWILETAGRDWAARRIESRGAISNALTIRRDYEQASTAVSAARLDFAQRFDTRLMPAFACADARRRRALAGLDASKLPAFSRMAAQLRMHARDNENPADGSNADLCMHAAGFIRRHQTTGSMIARLAPDGADALFTGTSAPCLSIFRPARFDGDWTVLTREAERIHAPLWRRHEWLHRWALADPGLRERLRTTRDVIEPQIFALIALGDVQGARRADRLAASWHKVLWESLSGLEPPRLGRFWRRVAAGDGIDPTRA
ncbi:C69 family dipeptidase [Sinimarinibacterium thermocellulolyticum]|uniref:Dipeptidase n=1 Tax=Sinimarinibacterium thermocellulolyticum TaxID=3170016 RepID=A0ABV2A9I2_9GAMM